SYSLPRLHPPLLSPRFSFCRYGDPPTLPSSLHDALPISAAVLIGLLPELGRRTGKQIAMLAGLAPVNQDSGTHRGQRVIRGGRRRVRQALYMAAVASLTTASPLSAFYRRLRDAGKPAKVALVALARRILTTLNAMV